MKKLFKGNPDLVEAMSKIIAERRVLLTAKSKEEEIQMDEESKGVFDSIRNFFGLK